ncbi:MAG: hypothetical protein ACJAWQ_001890 [Paraglaciecola sp.]|jgi:hypothetical protein
MNDLMNKKLNINEQKCSIVVNNNEHVSLTTMSHCVVINFLIPNKIVLNQKLNRNKKIIN